MKIVEEPKDDEFWVNFLLYGPPKTGKSAGAASVGGPVLFLNANTPNATRYARKRNPNIIEVEYESRAQTMDEIAEEAMKPRGQRMADTYVVDEVGELYRRLLEEESSRAISPSLPTYQRVGVLIERWCRHMVAAPANFVMVCHEGDWKDEATGEIQWLPFTGSNTSAKLGLKLLGLADVVAYTGVRQNDETHQSEYVGQVINAKGRRGGDRFSVLDDGRGYRPLDLAEWRSVIGKSLGVTQPKNQQKSPPKKRDEPKAEPTEPEAELLAANQPNSN